MKKYTFFSLLFVLLVSCVDNTLDDSPNDENFPLQLLLDAEEGGDLAGAEDYGLEITFADYLGNLPSTAITIDYEIFDLEDFAEGTVYIDKVVYEVELDDCTYERELEFNAGDDGLSGTITIVPDSDLGSVPESFEIIFALPGEGSQGKFGFAISGIESGHKNLVLGTPMEFEYETLDNDVAGEWELSIESEEEFESFKEIFGPLNNELGALAYEDITGNLKAEFEFEEMKFIVELLEEEEISTCEDGEVEIEIVNKVIEIEAEYEAEDGELTLEGSHIIVGDDGETDDELDFIVESVYEDGPLEDNLTIRFLKVVDEDNFDEGEELFRQEDGAAFIFSR